VYTNFERMMFNRMLSLTHVEMFLFLIYFMLILLHFNANANYT